MTSRADNDPDTVEGSRRILVVGSTRPLGELIVKEALSSGHSVVGIDLHETPPLQNSSNSLIVGDLTDDAFLAKQLKVADIVVLALNDRRPNTSYDELAVLNLDLPERLFKAAREAGCECFVYLSEAGVAGGHLSSSTSQTVIRARRPDERTLHDAEVLLRGLANQEEESPRLIILRTAIVYGFAKPRGELWLALPPILSLYFSLVPGLTGGPRFHCVHAEDVARASIYLSVGPSEQKVLTYTVADETPVTVGEFFNLLVDAYGYSLGVKLPFPSVGLVAGGIQAAEHSTTRRLLDKALTRLWKSVCRRYGLKTEFRPVLSASSLSDYLEELMSKGIALERTDFSLNHPDCRVGIPQMVQHYQEAGYLPSPTDYQRATDDGNHHFATSFTEISRGECNLEIDPSEARNVELTARMVTPGLTLSLQDRTWNLDGVVSIDGIATNSNAVGTVEISWLKNRQLRYQFGFVADDGRRLRLTGLKKLRLFNLLESLAQIEIDIHDDRGRLFAKGILRVDRLIPPHPTTRGDS